MSEPIIEQIAEAVALKIRGVKVESGYMVNVDEVIRPTRSAATTARDANVVYVRQGEEKITEPDEDAAGLVERVQEFLIWFSVKAPDDSTVPYDRLINRFRCDIEKALMTEKSTRFSELATQINIGGSEHFGDGGAISFLVTYRTKESDPYSL